MYCAADVSRENPANCLLNFMKSEHAVEHDEITVKLLYTFTLVTQFKDQNTGQTSWKLSFHLSGKACQKSCPNSFIPPRVGVGSSASLCMGAMHPCLYLLSNVSKERQPVKKKKKAQTTYLILVLLSAWRVARWASPVGRIYIQIHRTACFVAATPACLHEELERMCSCQLSASASRQRGGKSVVSPLILKLRIGSGHHPVRLWWTEELLLEFICIPRSCYYTVCAGVVLFMKMKVNQQSLLQTSL